MDELNERVGQAHRRLIVQQWLGRLVKCLFVAMLVALVGVTVPKMVALPSLPDWWNEAWIGGSALLAFVVSGIWSYRWHTSRAEAAVEVDLRYDLRERTASSLLMSEEQRATAAGAALVEDARRAVERVEVTDEFSLKPTGRVWLPLVPALAMFLVVLLVGNQSAESRPDGKSPVVAEEEVKKAIEKSRKQLAKRLQEAEKKGLTDATGLLKDIDAGTKDLAKLAKNDRTKAIVKLNNMAKQLEKRRQQLGGAKAMRKQLNQMKDLGKGPAGKVAQAMKQGDWKKAAAEIAKMQKDLASGKISKEQKQQLANQMGKMQQALKKAAAKQQQQQADLKKQLAEAQRKGDLNQASKLQQKMDQMKQQMPQMQAMQQMAQQMQKAQQAMEQGNTAQAQQAMQQMAQQMQALQQQADSMEMLDAAMTDIEMAKMGMGMKPGLKQGMRPGNGQGQGKGNQMGQGMGEGQGGGYRPDEKNPTNFRDTHVKQNVGRGASTFGGLVRGPSIKGQVTADVKQELSAKNVEPADPLTSERLPRSRREHAEEYFRKLREEL